MVKAALLSLAFLAVALADQPIVAAGGGKPGGCPATCDPADPECIQPANRVLDRQVPILGVFHSLSVSDCINVHSVYAPVDQTVLITGDANFINFVELNVVNGVLNIAIRDGILIQCQQPGCAQNELTVRVKAPSVVYMEATGLSTIRTFPDPRQMMFDNFKAVAGGNSKISISTIAREVTTLYTMDHGSIVFDEVNTFPLQQAEGQKLIAKASGDQTLSINNAWAADMVFEAHQNATLNFSTSRAAPHHYDSLSISVDGRSTAMAMSSGQWVLDGVFKAAGGGPAFIHAAQFPVKRLYVDQGPSELPIAAPSVIDVSTDETLRACIRGTGNVILHDGDQSRVLKHITDEGHGNVFNTTNAIIGTEDHLVCFDYY